VIVEDQEFAESKSNNSQGGNQGQNNDQQQYSGDGFMDIPDGIDEALPFNQVVQILII